MMQECRIHATSICPIPAVLDLLDKAVEGFTIVYAHHLARINGGLYGLLTGDSKLGGAYPLGLRLFAGLECELKPTLAYGQPGADVCFTFRALFFSLRDNTTPLLVSS